MTNEQIRDFLEKHAEKQFKDFTSSLIPDRFDSGSAASGAALAGEAARKGRLENLSQGGT